MRQTILSIISGTILLFGAFVISSIGTGSNNAHATEAGSDTRVNLNLASLINISNAGTTIMTCDSPNNLCTTNASITVKTNNATGYTLQMNTTNGYSNALTNNATSDTVPTLSQSYSSANFPVNHWGYTGGIDKSSETGGYNCAANYCPVLAYQSTDSNYAPNHAIRITDTPGTSSVTDITFGSKVSNIQPAGTYSTSVTFTAVANYATPTTFQNFTSSDCAKATTDQTFTLTDSRDGTDYTVAKLRDGNCWMTQNLELGEYGKPMKLTNADSNVSAEGYTLNFQFANDTIYKGNNNKYGNYYVWSQATAGSALPATGESASYDICPKGWRLPRTTNVATNSEFYILLQNYITTGSWGGTSWSGVTTSQFTNAPLSIVYTGYVDLDGNLNNLELYGSLWSSTLRNSSYIYKLDVNTSGRVDPFDGGTIINTIHQSMRCLIPSS